MMTDTKPLSWARLWATAAPRETRHLRQGMWYQVLDDSDETSVVLDIDGQQVRAPRRLFELRELMPSRFTVVYRTLEARNPLKGTKSDLGRVYGVCPQCGHRVRLGRQALMANCPRCDHRGEVAWWETG